MIKIRYMKKRMSNRQFTEFIESKVKNTVEKHHMIKEGDKVLVGLSGGKDSAVMYRILKKLYPNVKITGFFIDLGIYDFSKKSLEKIKELVGNDELIVYDLEKEEGFTIPEAAKKLNRPPCSICGTVKRYIINKYAWENGYNKIAMGHTMDDEASNIFKEFVNGDINQFVRLGPVLPGKEKLVERIKPLYRNYDGENLLYARINNIPFIEEKCPLAIKNRKYKKWLRIMERDSPGIELTMLHSYKVFKKSLDVEEPKLNHCKICGYLTTGEICSFCRIKMKLKEKE